MPQHEVGYRPWNGQTTAQAGRWRIITDTGFRLVFKSMWVRRLLFLAWLPIFYFGTIFFILENPDILGPQKSAQNQGGMMEALDKVKTLLCETKTSEEIHFETFFKTYQMDKSWLNKSHLAVLRNSATLSGAFS